MLNLLKNVKLETYYIFQNNTKQIQVYTQQCSVFPLPLVPAIGVQSHKIGIQSKVTILSFIHFFYKYIRLIHKPGRMWQNATSFDSGMSNHRDSGPSPTLFDVLTATSYKNSGVKSLTTA